MDPRTLTAENFSSYPPLAKKVALEHLELLRKLPVPLAAALLRQTIDYDTRFPRERAAIDGQFAFLKSLNEAELSRTTAGFAKITLPATLVDEDWVRFPHKFEEDLSAYLWASGQIDAYHVVGTRFADEMYKAMPPAEPAMPRWTVVILGPELRKDQHPLFAKLRPHGVFFNRVDGKDGMQAVLSELSARAAKSSDPYDHWYIDGAAPAELGSRSFSEFSWQGSSAMRAKVLREVNKVIGSGKAGPEMLRSIMAAWRSDPEVAASPDPLVDRFVQSVYGEGSGTQIFSTTFVQWSTRELLRRAEPVSVVTRFGPRQRQQGMNEMFAGTANEMDFAGSLIDGDFGAYYAWINMNRLAGAKAASFVAWSQYHQQAIAIGSGLPRGTEAPDPITMERLLSVVAKA